MSVETSMYTELDELSMLTSSLAHLRNVSFFKQNTCQRLFQDVSLANILNQNVFSKVIQTDVKQLLMQFQ